MDIVKGIRPLDYVLTALMVGLGVLLGLENVNGSEADVAHSIDSTSAWIVPVFALAALPILWRRRNIVAAVFVSAVVFAVSVLAFGWIVRCGFGLPLSFAMAYGVARFGGSKQQQLVGLGGIALMQVAVLVKDSATDGISPIVGALPIALVFYGIGLIVQNRSEKQAGLETPLRERVPA